MRLFRVALLSFFCGFPAYATDVNFSGTLASICTIAVTTPGILDLSSDGTVMGSGEGLGLPATITILSVGTNMIDVAAPTLTASPVGYSTTGQSLEVSYLGVGGLALINQAYTSSPTSFAANNIPLSVLTVNNRIVNANGFAAGSYGTRTVVTCS